MQRKREHDVSKKEIEPDNELLLWEKWIKIREEEVTKLAEKLNKPPVDLAMNLLERVREEKEWKTVLEDAKIEEKPTIRGQLWELPPRLKQPCYCMPVYEVQRTKAEKGKPPVIKHIREPEYIKTTEKGLIGARERIECKQLNADFLKYRKKREEDLKEKLLKIDPFRPIASDLIVRGSKPKKPPPKMPPVPSIEITESPGSSESALYSVYAVRINNTIIWKNIPDQNLSGLEKLRDDVCNESCTTWNYYFKAPTKRAGRCKLFLQNLGTVTLRYCWKKIKKTVPFIPEDIYEQVFFFNKNEDVLSPGQSKEIFFTFISDKPGIYNESWELHFCNICFNDTVSEIFCVNLDADAFVNAKCIQRKIETLQAKIRRQAIVNIVHEIMQEIIIKATNIEPQHYPYKELFLEAELFELKNPVCFYHQTEVMKMTDLYSEMSPKTKWDLSIKSWRDIMISKEFDERMKYYDLLKKSHAELLKPWYEGEDLLMQKYRAVKLLLGQMADMFDKKYDQLVEMYALEDNIQNGQQSQIKINVFSAMEKQKIWNIFYVHVYDYVSTTMEMCAGVLSSLDLNRWIEFDFCRKF